MMLGIPNVRTGMKITSDIRSVRQLSVSLRDARTARGITQAELAEKAGVSRPWINQFEQGKLRNASINRIFTLCRILGVTPSVSYDVPDEMITDTYDPSSQNQIAEKQNRDDTSAEIESSVVDETTAQQSTKKDNMPPFPSYETKGLLSSANWQETLKEISRIIPPTIDSKSISHLVQQWGDAKSLFGESYIRALNNLDLSRIAMAGISASPQEDDPMSGEENREPQHEQNQNA